MNSSLRKYWFLTAFAVLLFSSASFAQTTSVVLTGVGNGATVWSGGTGVYLDPYTATVGGVPGTSVICDDWSDNSYVNESWTANVTTLASLNAGTNSTTNPPMFGNDPGLYNQLAWLATQLMVNPTSYANQVAVSFAIWELTYPYSTNPETPSPTSFLAGSAQAGQQSCSGQTCVNTLLSEAAAAVANGYTGDGWSILTPIAGTITPTNLGVPQEFLVHVPESSTLAMLGADFLGLLALGLFFRRRGLQPVS